jgi:TldD protein
MISRRELLLTGASSAAALAAACGPKTPAVVPPAPVVDRLGLVLDRALDAARKAGATYADARIMRRRWERVETREDVVAELLDVESYGIGVRVIADGAWGFAATARVEEEDAEEAAKLAVQIARADAKVLKRAVELAPVGARKATWSTELRIDPFKVRLDEKIEMLLAMWRAARDVPEIKHGVGRVTLHGEWKIFASTEGSRIEQSVTRVEPHFEVTAIDSARGDFVTRAHELPGRQTGWEYVVESSFRTDGRKMADDAVRKLRAPRIAPGKRDLVLAPSNLWLTIHESVGHPTELDRVLGLEANLAGTSFATTEKLGKFRYASPIVTIYADKTTRGGMASCGFDDDGEETQRWDLVKDGVLVGYQTTRDQAAWIGEKRSRGTSYAQDYKSFPFQRMPNVSLAPSEKEISLDDIVAATDDGVLVTGNGSWSIDHQRYNFQFGGQMFFRIEKGKITTPLRDVAYQSSTPEFWNACDMIGGPKSWELHGALNDGKGEPQQIQAVGHGCPPARFRRVNILDTHGRES